MNKIIGTGILLLAVACSKAPVPSFLQEINRHPDGGSRQTAVEKWLDRAKDQGLPYQTKDSVFFLFQGEADHVQLAGSMNDWDPVHSPLQRLPGTRLWYRGYAFPAAARVEYKFVLNKQDWILDPLNPDSALEGEFPNSLLEMPEYRPSDWANVRPGVPQGRLDTCRIKDPEQRLDYSYQVYVPPGYDSLIEVRFPVVYFHDGSDYIHRAQATVILDNLIAEKKLRPLIAVFLDPNDRNAEYAFDKQAGFIRFFQAELIPKIDAQYLTMASPQERASIGTSLGGLLSARICFGQPDLVANCGVQSGAYWPNNGEIIEYMLERKEAPVRYAAAWGTLEGVWQENRVVRDGLLVAGGEVYWKEVPEGHNWGQWRATLGELLMWLFPL